MQDVHELEQRGADREAWLWIWRLRYLYGEEGGAETAAVGSQRFPWATYRQQFPAALLLQDWIQEGQL